MPSRGYAQGSGRALQVHGQVLWLHEGDALEEKAPDVNLNTSFGCSREEARLNEAPV